MSQSGSGNRIFERMKAAAGPLFAEKTDNETRFRSPTRFTHQRILLTAN